MLFLSLWSILKQNIPQRWRSIVSNIWNGGKQKLDSVLWGFPGGIAAGGLLWHLPLFGINRKGHIVLCSSGMFSERFDCLTNSLKIRKINNMRLKWKLLKKKKIYIHVQQLESFCYIFRVLFIHKITNIERRFKLNIISFYVFV